MANPNWSEVTRCVLWVYGNRAPEWSNVRDLERELFQAGWSRSQARGFISAAKQFEADEIALETGTDV